MTPQPVLKNAFATGFALALLTQVASFTSYMGWWTPSGEDLLQYAGLAGLVVGVVIFIQGYFVHNRTTPTSTVALTHDDVKLIEAASDPQVPVGMGLLRDQVQIARDRVPPLLPTQPVKAAVKTTRRTRKATS